MTTYRVRHRTTYRYLQEVSYSQHLLHLEPRPTAQQQVLESRVSVTPAPAERNRRLDGFGNLAEWMTLDEVHGELEILAESRVAATAPQPRDAAASLPWEETRRRLEAAEEASAREAVPFLFDSPYVRFQSDLASYAAASFPAGRPVMAGAVDLMARIHRDFRYDTTVTDVTTPVDRVFEIRAGVCQDLAHVAIACVRSIGLAARYVSGYLLTRPPPGKEKMLGADASHAWFAVWCPRQGWIDLDPTNDLQPGEEHITVGWGRDYGDVAPINGVVVGGADHSVEVGVDVLPE